MQAERFAEFLGIFADVARESSFSGAARRRGITPSSAARQIDALESHLETKLFLRSTRTLTLTDAGQALLARARRILDEIADAQQEISSMKGEVGGWLRVACFATFGKRYVLPVIAALTAKYPQLRVELDLTERIADPVAERLDAVIRIGELADSTLIATRIATQTSVLCASADYLSRFLMPQSSADLIAHRILDKLHGADLLGWASVLGPAIANSSTQAVFRCDDFEALRLAALNGMGVAYMPDWVVGEDIRDGKLERILPELTTELERRTGIYVLRALAQPSAKLRAFMDELKLYIGSPPKWSC